MNKLMATVLLVSSANLYSEQWQILGTRAMGMGGAYVAMARGPLAQYWNPAGLAQISTQNYSGLEINAGAGIEATGGLLSNVSEITEVSEQLDAIKQTQTSGTIDAKQMSAFVKTLGILSKMNEKDDSGALVEVAGGLNIKFSKLAISINNFSSVGLNPFIDATNINVVNSGSAGTNIPTNTSPVPPNYNDEATELANIITQLAGNSNLANTPLANLLCGAGTCANLPSTTQDLANALINQAISNGATEDDINNFIEESKKYVDEAANLLSNIGGSFKNNTSNINVKAASFTEFAIGYARPIDKWLSGLSVGANIKLIRGQVGNKNFEFLKEDETGDAFKDINDYLKTSSKPSLDIGFLWNVNDKYPKLPFKPRIGLAIRNILSPSFDGPNGKYTLDRQARLGIAISPFNWWHFAMDIDITKNSTPVDGFYSRQLCVGTEINILNRKSFNLPLRLGLMKNIAESDSKTLYTAGFGLTFAYIHFEAAAGISSGEQKIDDKKIPEKVQGVVNFGILF